MCKCGQQAKFEVEVSTDKVVQWPNGRVTALPETVRQCDRCYWKQLTRKGGVLSCRKIK